MELLERLEVHCSDEGKDFSSLLFCLLLFFLCVATLLTSCVVEVLVLGRL